MYMENDKMSQNYYNEKPCSKPREININYLIDAIHYNIFLKINLETFEIKSRLSPFKTVVAIAICRQAKDIYLMLYIGHTVFMFYTCFPKGYIFLPIIAFY